MCLYKSGLKSLSAYVILAVDDFFDQWDPSIATPMEEMYKAQGKLLKNKPLITFHECVLVRLNFSANPHVYVKREKKVRWELYKNATCYFEPSLKQHLTKYKLYSHLPPISLTIQVK